MKNGEKIDNGEHGITDVDENAVNKFYSEHVDEETVERAITENAIIKSYSIDREEANYLQIGLQVEYAYGCQGFGRFNFQDPKGSKDFSYKSTAGYFLLRIMEICNVDNFKDIVGKTIRVKHTRFKIISIGNIIHDDWFDPQKDLFDKINSEDEFYDNDRHNCYNRSDFVQFCKFIDKISFSFAVLRNEAYNGPREIIFSGTHKEIVRKYLKDNALIDEKELHYFDKSIKSEQEYYAFTIAGFRLIWNTHSVNLEPIAHKALEWNMKLQEENNY